MLKRTGISLVAALGLIIPTVALAGVAGLDDPTGVLSANDNQGGEDNGAEVLQEEATPAVSPEADDDDAQQDALETPNASPEADDEDAAEDQDEPGDVNDADDGEDVDEAEDEDGGAEDADEAGDVDDTDEAEDDDGGAGAGTSPPGS
jgi:hypothetical protein